jgi:hypothetical protein
METAATPCRCRSRRAVPDAVHQTSHRPGWSWGTVRDTPWSTPAPATLVPAEAPPFLPTLISCASSSAVHLPTRLGPWIFSTPCQRSRTCRATAPPGTAGKGAAEVDGRRVAGTGIQYINRGTRTKDAGRDGAKGGVTQGEHQEVPEGQGGGAGGWGLMRKGWTPGGAGPPLRVCWMAWV